MRRVLIGAAALVLACCSSTGDADSTVRPGRVPRTSPTTVRATATWEVTCPGRQEEVRYFTGGSAGRVSITVETPSGTSQQQDVINPISVNFTPGLFYCFGVGEFVYISAQNSGASGDVQCRIEVDGRITARNVSSGGYAIASCSGRS